MMDKTDLRHTIRDRRNNISVEKRTIAAAAAAENLSQHKTFIKSEKIACYLSNDGEIETQQLISICAANQKKCYLPVLHSEEEGRLHFIHYKLGDTLVANKYNIPEPVVEERKVCLAEELDLVLAPLVAFDKQGHRLGMGGGFYDQTFNFLLNKKVNKPLLIGVAYDLQEVDALDREEWDVPLDGVLTESGLKFF